MAGVIPGWKMLRHLKSHKPDFTVNPAFFMPHEFIGFAEIEQDDPICESYGDYEWNNCRNLPQECRKIQHIGNMFNQRDSFYSVFPNDIPYIFIQGL